MGAWYFVSAEKKKISKMSENNKATIQHSLLSSETVVPDIFSGSVYYLINSQPILVGKYYPWALLQIWNEG